MNTAPSVTYVSVSGDGHHSDFDRLFMAAAGDIGVNLHQVTNAANATDPRAPLFYSMLDQTPRQTLAALLRAVWRSATGRKTAGLFFRPLDCFVGGSVKSRIRKYLFACASRLPGIYILSLVPGTLSPHIACVATDWIYDPQLWDLSYLGIPPLADPARLERMVSEKAQGRRVIVALGGQNRIKGFDFFADIWCASPEIRKAYLFVAAGKVSAESRDSARRFEADGGLLIDARIDDAELFYMYSRASAVWSCYAPDYDQSSGIHGRAVQLGLPVIVRRESLIEKLGTILAHPTLALPFADPGNAARLLAEWTPQTTDQKTRDEAVRRMQDHSLAVLQRAMT